MMQLAEDFKRAITNMRSIQPGKGKQQPAEKKNGKFILIKLVEMEKTVWRANRLRLIAQESAAENNQ